MVSSSCVPTLWDYTVTMMLYVPEDSTLHSHSCENLRSKTVCVAFCCVVCGNFNVQL